LISFNINGIGLTFRNRIDVVHDEIRRGLQRPTAAPDYVGWVLAELDFLRTSAMQLAVDDTYVTQGSAGLNVDAFDGLLMNDVDQAFRTITLDTSFDMHPDYIEPSNGTLEVMPDGSFNYTPDPGFIGVDTFNYRSMTMIAGVPEPVYSQPAQVVVVVEDGACSPVDFDGDGTLTFFDVSAFLVAYQAEDPIADLNNDGAYNFFDVSAFLVAFGEGCP